MYISHHHHHHSIKKNIVLFTKSMCRHVLFSIKVSASNLHQVRMNSWNQFLNILYMYYTGNVFSLIPHLVKYSFWQFHKKHCRKYWLEIHIQVYNVHVKSYFELKYIQCVFISCKMFTMFVYLSLHFIKRHVANIDWIYMHVSRYW